MPIVSKLPTYRVEICTGLAPGYAESSAVVLGGQRLTALSVCYNYCQRAKMGLMVFDTSFMHPGGQESGMVISIANYPRYPTKNSTVLQHALALAEELMRVLDQERLTVVEVPGETFLVERHKPA
jgi:hypothetical protein